MWLGKGSKKKAEESVTFSALGGGGGGGGGGLRSYSLGDFFAAQNPLYGLRKPQN